jgi:hypothetical protein
MTGQASMIPLDDKDQQIHDLALAWDETKAAHKIAGAEKETARVGLVAAMEAQGKTAYKDRDVDVELIDRGMNPKVSIHVQDDEGSAPPDGDDLQF